MAILAIRVLHVKAMVSFGKDRAGRIVAGRAKVLFVFSQERLGLTRMCYVTLAAVPTGRRCVDQSLVHLALQVCVATDTEGRGRLGGQRLKLRRMRFVAIEALAVAKWLVLHRGSLQISHIGMTRETELIAVVAQKFGEIRRMDHVAVITLAAHKGSVRYGHRAGGLYQIMACATHRVHVADQLHCSVWILAMAGVARLVRERRVVILAKQFRLFGAVRIMTIAAVGVGQRVAAMFITQLFV